MTLSQHYHAAQSLSPKAARLAARLLDGAPDIPFEWRLSLRMALLERGRRAASFTTTDLAPISSDEANSPKGRRAASSSPFRATRPPKAEQVPPDGSGAPVSEKIRVRIAAGTAAPQRALLRTPSPATTVLSISKSTGFGTWAW
jgi:hypothetical protein